MGEGILAAACRLEREARAKWGATAQAFMVCEEAGELATAMAHHVRGRATDADLLDEAADGIIVSCAAAVLAGKDAGDLATAVYAKLNRLGRRINGEEGHFGQPVPVGIKEAKE